MTDSLSSRSSRSSVESDVNDGAVGNEAQVTVPSPNPAAIPVSRPSPRNKYLGNLGIVWSKDRAKSLSDRSAERVKSDHSRAKSEGTEQAGKLEPSLEALLLRGKHSSSRKDIGAENGNGTSSVTQIQSSAPPSSSSTPVVLRPRRDVRRQYLSNLGIGMAGPPAARLGRSMSLGNLMGMSPPLDVVEERLKDPQEQEMTFDDLVKALGSFVGAGGGKPKEKPPQAPAPCEVCARAAAAAGGSETPIPCPHKRVRFSTKVAAVYIPPHRDYSNRVRQSYWNSAGEIREMVYRNMLEYDAEGYSWQNVAEEDDMFYCENTGEYIHPVFLEDESQDDNIEYREFDR